VTQGLKHLTWEQRLRELGVFSEDDQAQGDSINLYKYLKGEYKDD